MMLGFQTSSSQNSCVTDRPNAKRKKKRRGAGRVWPKDSKDRISVDIFFFPQKSRNNADSIRAGSEADSSVVLIYFVLELLKL